STWDKNARREWLGTDVGGAPLRRTKSVGVAPEIQSGVKHFLERLCCLFDLLLNRQHLDDVFAVDAFPAHKVVDGDGNIAKSGNYRRHEQVTAIIVDAIEHGVGAFEMPWHAKDVPLRRAQNAASGLQYRGANIVTLW